MMLAQSLAATPVLETPRLILRAPQASDFPAFAAYAASERTRFVGGAKPHSAAFEKFASMIGHWPLRGFGRFVLVEKASGAPLGHAGPLQLDEAMLPELTWTLWSGAAEGQGFAREAMEAVLPWMRELGVPEARSEVHRDNARSHRLALALGGVPCPELSGWMPGAMVYRFDLGAAA
ncbi:MAG: GNAT family N-acetyltransferase [Pararhodobacter sp.]